MKKLKTAILSILVVLSIGLDIWYGWILLFAPTKIAAQTFIVGAQTIKYKDMETGEKTEESKLFIEINSYDNCFEIKFNELQDENKDAFYSTGMQFYTNADKLDFSGKYASEYSRSNCLTVLSRATGWFLGLPTEYEDKRIYHRSVGNKQYNNLEFKTYASGDNFTSSLSSDGELNENTKFKIEIGGEMYGLALKYDDTGLIWGNNNFYVGTTSSYESSLGFPVKRNTYNVYDEYRVCDFTYFAEMLYQRVSSLNYTSDAQVYKFKFSDLFNFYKANEKLVYEQVNNKTDEWAKVEAWVNTYMQISVKKNHGKLTNASQSLFKCVNGTPNFETKEENVVYDDYGIGRTIFDLTEDNFKPVYSNNENTYKLRLSDNFINQWKDSSNQIMLRVKIDLDELKSIGITFDGFAAGTFKDFKIYKLYTVETVNNKVVEKVVSYV